MIIYDKIVFISKDNHIFQKVLSAFDTCDNIYDSTFLSYMFSWSNYDLTIFWHIIYQNHWLFYTTQNTVPT
jgi:hypothetical protein